MAKLWLILLDIIIHFSLWISLILFYLYMYQEERVNIEPMKEQNTIKEQNITFKIPYTFNIDFNTTMLTLDDIKQMGEAYCPNDEYMIKDVYLIRTLEESLTKTHTKVGDAVFIRIFKEEGILEVWIDNGVEYVHLKDYTICASSGRLGPKLKEGDRQSPEGFYEVKMDQLNPNSKYHLSFNLGYPNAYDRAHERTGSFLMVHGNCVSVGCYAMTDEKIEEIYSLVEAALKNGQKSIQIHIFPFTMTEENMNLYEGNEWYEFWLNLKEGYDYFEAEKLPPKIEVEEKRYVIYEYVKEDF